MTQEISTFWWKICFPPPCFVIYRSDYVWLWLGPASEDLPSWHLTDPLTTALVMALKQREIKDDKIADYGILPSVSPEATKTNICKMLIFLVESI